MATSSVELMRLRFDVLRLMFTCFCVMYIPTPALSSLVLEASVYFIFIFLSGEVKALGRRISRGYSFFFMTKRDNREDRVKNNQN